MGTLHDEIDEELGITPEDHLRWDSLTDTEGERIAQGKLWYENDYIVLEDLHVIEHKGRKFLIRIEEIRS
jgi:hypothetical protein